MKSIRQYLLWGLFATLLLASFISFVISYLATTEEINELLDAQLIENSRFVGGFLNKKNKPNLEQINEALLQVKATQLEKGQSYNSDTHAYERKIAIQVWDQKGHLLLSTPSAPTHALSPLAKGFFQQKTGKHIWFIYTHQIPANHYWLMVAERSDIREEMLNKILLSMLSGTIIALGLMVMLIGHVIKKGLSPLTKLSRAMQERDLDYLQPVKLNEPPPDELKPVLHALNHLLTRLDEGLDRERRFLADAAHELRTPLTVLKLQLQVAQNSPDIQKMQQGIDKALIGVNRSAHTVEQLLTLARLEPHKQALMRERIEMVGFTQEVIAGLFPLAQEKQQSLALNQSHNSIEINGNRLLLTILLRNLIENAIKYSPQQASISVTLTLLSQHLQLQIADTGCGVPEADIPRLMQRFYRHQNTADSRGTGLGLSIVQKILELHDGQIHIKNRAEGGLMVDITLPITSFNKPDN